MLGSKASQLTTFKEESMQEMEDSRSVEVVWRVKLGHERAIDRTKEGKKRQYTALTRQRSELTSGECWQIRVGSTEHLGTIEDRVSLTQVINLDQRDSRRMLATAGEYQGTALYRVPMILG